MAETGRGKTTVSEGLPRLPTEQDSETKWRDGWPTTGVAGWTERGEKVCFLRFLFFDYLTRVGKLTRWMLADFQRTWFPTCSVYTWVCFLHHGLFVTSSWMGC